MAGTDQDSTVMLQALISILESQRLSLEAKLRHINARKIEEREYRVEGALRDGYDAIARGFANCGESLREEVLTCRIPVVLFEIGLELGWLTRETAEQSSFYWSEPFDYRNPPPIKAATASLGSHTVQEAFKAWFLAVLAGRIESWRGFALTQEGLDDGSAQLANPPNQSGDPARLLELPKQTNGKNPTGYQGPKETRWYILCRTGDDSSMRAAAFERLVRRAMHALGKGFSRPPEAVNGWIDLLVERSGHKGFIVDTLNLNGLRDLGLCDASAELLAELSVQLAEVDRVGLDVVLGELEKQFRELGTSGSKICALQLEGPEEPFERDVLLAQFDDTRTVEHAKKLGMVTLTDPDIRDLPAEAAVSTTELTMPAQEIAADGPSSESSSPTDQARPSKPDRWNLDLLRGTDDQLKRAVTMDVARRYGGVTIRAIQDAARIGKLATEGQRLQRRVLVDSLLRYFPPEK